MLSFNTPMATAKKAAKKKLKPVKKTAKKTKRPAPKKKKAPAQKARVVEVPAPDVAEDNPLAEVKEVFDHYDRNDNGFIESGELSRLLEALEAAPETQLELSAAVVALDSNKSGKISWDEFKDWWLER